MAGQTQRTAKVGKKAAKDAARKKAAEEAQGGKSKWKGKGKEKDVPVDEGKGKGKGKGKGCAGGSRESGAYGDKRELVL